MGLICLRAGPAASWRSLTRSLELLGLGIHNLVRRCTLQSFGDLIRAADLPVEPVRQVFVPRLGTSRPVTCFVAVGSVAPVVHQQVRGAA